MVLSKLNYLLLENKLSRSVKVFEILKTITKNSPNLAGRLFQIVFNTRELFENLSQSKLANKIREIISAVGNEMVSKYDIFSDFYIKATKMSLNSPLLKNTNTICQNGAILIKNVSFHLSFLEYLQQLFNVTEGKKFLREKINRLFESLQENFISIQKLFNSNLMTQNDYVFESNKEILAKVLSYTISLIEIILDFASTEKFNACEMLANLFKMIKFSNEKAKYFSSSWSVLSNNVVLSDGNILISSRFLIRFIKNNPENTNVSSFKKPLFKLFQEDNFLSLISYAIIESDSKELSALAYEILFEIERESNQFNFEAYQIHSQRIKKEKVLKKNTNPKLRL